MPIYEYECKACGKRFDKRQPVTAEPLSECLLCGRGPVRRVFHPVGVIFKGSGWYVNDNRKSVTASSGNEKSSAVTGVSETTAKAPAEASSADKGE